MSHATRLSLLFTLIACTSGADLEPSELEVSCSGKCDGVESIRSLYRDARDLDLSDLAARGTSLASSELGDALSGDFLNVELDEPVAFGSSDLAATEDLVEDLDELTSGLLTRFGEGELSTEVNEIRLRHLSASSDDVFIESGFSFGVSLDHGFNLDADGFEDASVRVGLGSANISGRVVMATERDAGSSPEAILDAVREARGFVLPREVDELRSMKPGEAFALSGQGVFGLNLGAGVPIVIAASGPLTYNLVVSGALRAQIEGLMDVQLVRLEGDTVVVDIGTEGSSVRSARLAINDGWGVSGLVSENVELAGQNIDLGRLLDRALRKRLDERLNLLGAEVERTGRRSRLSVTRVRFDLGADGIEDALAQALRGDARLAQALSERDGSGVTLDYDISRSGLSSVSHAGVDLFGMRFFNTTIRAEGEAVVATPGGAQELLFDTLRRESGWLFESHGHGRVALSGLRFDADGAAVESEVNLFVQVVEGDRFMQRDTLLDHLDSLMTAVAGSEALSAIEGPGNDLQRLVEDTCAGGGAFDPCREEVLETSEVMSLRMDAADALRSATSGLTPSLAELVQAAGMLRIAAQATVEPSAALVGPPTGIVLDYRLDDRSVERIFGEQEGSDLRAALLQVLSAVRVDREDDESDIAADRDELAEREADVLDTMEAIFEAHSETYQSLSATERAEIRGIGVIGGEALAIELDGPVDYDDVVARSIVQARAQSVRDAFDELLDAARDLDNIRHEHALGYALLGMLPSASQDVRMSVDMDLSNNGAQNYDHYRAAGQAGFDAYGVGDVELIGGGVFDVESLINVE